MLLGVSAPTLSRPRLARRASDKTSGRRPRLTTRTFERVGAVVVCLCAAAGFFLYPTYPNYDSVYSLIWGRELLHLRAAVVRGLPRPDRASAGDRDRRGAVALRRQRGPPVRRAHGRELRRARLRAYALGRTAFTPLVGVVAAVLVITRFDFPFLAARGYIDIRSTSRSSSGRRCSSCAEPRRGLDRARAPRARRDAAPGGVAARRPVRAVGRLARVLAAAHRLRGARGGRARGLGPHRLPRHGQPDVLLHRHDRARRRAGPQQGRGRGARRDVELPHRPGEVPGRARRDRGLPPRARARAAQAHHAGRAVRVGRGDVRARRRRRPVGDLPLPARPVAHGDGAVRRRGRRVDDAAPRDVAASHLGRRGAAARAVRHRLHGDARQRRAAGLPAQLPRRRTRRVPGPHRPARLQGGARLRSGLDAEPQARARRALVPRPAAGQGHRAVVDATRCRTRASSSSSTAGRPCSTRRS